MQPKSIDIGGLHTPNNVFLAPLAGYTNAVFREMCYRLGAGLTFTEMVSAKGLCYGSKNTEELLFVTPTYDGIKAVQLFGSDPEYMRRAATSEQIAPFDLIDINMGCPVPKIFNNGEGSALLDDMPRASAIIKACKQSGKPVSVKFRIGITEQKLVAEDFAKMCEDSGADMITVHGRTRDKMYAGQVNFAEIEKVKRAVKIPVIANGGVFCYEDMQNLLCNTGADGVMVARGAMYAPWIFCSLTGRPEPDRTELVLKQLEDTLLLFGERFALVFMRKMAAFYTKGRRGSSALRERLFMCNSIPELRSLIEDAQF